MRRVLYVVKDEADDQVLVFFSRKPRVEVERDPCPCGKANCTVGNELAQVLNGGRNDWGDAYLEVSRTPDAKPCSEKFERVSGLTLVPNKLYRIELNVTKAE